MKISVLFLLSLTIVAPVAAQDFSGIVLEEKQKLLDAGFVFRVGHGDEGSEASRRDAAQITWRVAHRLAGMGNPVFLIHKNPPQNGCTHADGRRFSHDALVFQATCIDVLKDSETANVPVWNICTNPVVDPALWRPTFALDAVEPRPEPGPRPTEPDGGNDGSIDVLVSLMGSVEAAVVKMSGEMATKEQLAAHDAKVDQKFEEARGWVQTAKNPRTWLYGGGVAAVIELVRQLLNNSAPREP